VLAFINSHLSLPIYL